MDRLYASRCGVYAADQRQDIARFLLSDRVVEAILRRIQGGFNVREEIDPDLFKQAKEMLDEAIGQSFDLGTEWGKEDLAFIAELRHNAEVFAAFKAHREQNDLAALLLDEEGKPRSFDAFRKATEPVIGQYNVNWLRTEYTAAIRNARTARRFRAYQKDADLFPNLRWLKSRAAEPRFSHRKYYNTIRRIDDPWWLTHYPGCVWNCQCDMEQTADPITHVGDTPAMPGQPSTKPGSEGEVRAPGLSQNPALSKSLFSQDHPYFPQSCRSCSFGKRIGNIVNSGKNCFQCRASETAIWDMRIAMSLNDAKKAVLEELTKSGLINTDIKHSSLEKRKFSLSRDVYDRFMAHVYTAEEAWILQTLPSNLSSLKNRMKSELGDNKDLLDPRQIRNIERKRERGVKYYNLYEYEYRGKTWIIGMEVSKIEKKWKEEPYFIKKK